MSESASNLHLTVSPEPTDEELAVILAAIAVAMTPDPPSPNSEMRPASRWARQGRIEAMSDRERIGDDGWR